MHLQSCKNPDRTNSKEDVEINRYNDWKLLATCKVVLHQIRVQATSSTTITMISTRNETGQTRSNKILSQSSHNMNSNSETSGSGENPVYHKGVIIGYGYKSKKTDIEQPDATEPDSVKVTPFGKTSNLNFKIQQRDTEITGDSSTKMLRTEVPKKDKRESESSSLNIFSDSSSSRLAVPVAGHSTGNNSRQDNSTWKTKTLKNQPDVSVKKNSPFVDPDDGDVEANKMLLIDNGGGNDISNRLGTSLTDTRTGGSCNNGKGKVLDISLISNGSEKSGNRHCNICGEKLASRTGAHSFIKWKDEKWLRMCLTCNQKIPNGSNSRERDHHKASCLLNRKEDNYHFSVSDTLDEDEVDENKMYRLVACTKCTNSARYGSFQFN